MTIVVSLLPVEKWWDIFENSMLTHDFLYDLVHTSHKIKRSRKSDKKGKIVMPLVMIGQIS